MNTTTVAVGLAKRASCDWQPTHYLSQRDTFPLLLRKPRQRLYLKLPFLKTRKTITP